MSLLVIPGALIAMLGLVGLLVCIRKAGEAKKLQDDPEALKAMLKKLVTLNMASLMTAVFGLIVIVIGLIL